MIFLRRVLDTMRYRGNVYDRKQKTIRIEILLQWEKVRANRITKFLAVLKTLSFNKRTTFDLTVSSIHCNYNFDDNVELESFKIHCLSIAS